MKSNPYPGIRPFEEKDYLSFFGRETQIEKLKIALKNYNFVCAIGPSGCGKTSLVNAGLFPELSNARNAISSLGWNIVTFTPSDRPFENLAGNIYRLLKNTAKEGKGRNGYNSQSEEDILSELNSAPMEGISELLKNSTILDDNNVLIFIDQFEELFTRGGNTPKDSSVRRQFLELLYDTVSSNTKNLYLMIAMRSEFIARANISKEFLELIERSLFIVPELDESELSDAIKKPSKGLLKDSDDFVTNLSGSLADDRDKLPLIQAYMSLVWREFYEENDKSSTAPFTFIKDMGPKKKINWFADKIYYEGLAIDKPIAGWSQEYMDIAKYIFNSICKMDSSGEKVRSPLSIELIGKLTGISTNKIIAVADLLRTPETGLLRPFYDKNEPVSEYNKPHLATNDILDVPHESLIRNWERLSKWVARSARLVRVYKQLCREAVRWKFARSENDKNNAILHGIHLKSAADWRERVCVTVDGIIIKEKVTAEWLTKNYIKLTEMDLDSDEYIIKKCLHLKNLDVRDIVYEFIKESEKYAQDAVLIAKERAENELQLREVAEKGKEQAEKATEKAKKNQKISNILLSICLFLGVVSFGLYKRSVQIEDLHEAQNLMTASKRYLIETKLIDLDFNNNKDKENNRTLLYMHSYQLYRMATDNETLIESDKQGDYRKYNIKHCIVTYRYLKLNKYLDELITEDIFCGKVINDTFQNTTTKVSETLDSICKSKKIETNLSLDLHRKVTEGYSIAYTKICKNKPLPRYYLERLFSDYLQLKKSSDKIISEIDLIEEFEDPGKVFSEAKSFHDRHEVPALEKDLNGKFSEYYAFAESRNLTLELKKTNYTDPDSIRKVIDKTYNISKSKIGNEFIRIIREDGVDKGLADLCECGSIISLQEDEKIEQICIISSHKKRGFNSLALYYFAIGDYDKVHANYVLHIDYLDALLENKDGDINRVGIAGLIKQKEQIEVDISNRKNWGNEKNWKKGVLDHCENISTKMPTQDKYNPPANT